MKGILVVATKAKKKIKVKLSLRIKSPQIYSSFTFSRKCNKNNADAIIKIELWQLWNNIKACKG